MFEADEAIVEDLLHSDARFKALYEQHAVLKRQVQTIEDGKAAGDDAQLVALKRKKLLTKDRLADIIEFRRRKQSTDSPASVHK